MEEFNPDETFSVNIHEIANTKRLMNITTQLAKRIIDQGYITVGDAISSISDRDLDKLITLIPTDDNMDTLTEQSGELMLISELLAFAEGLPSSNAEDIMTRTSLLTKLLMFESLYRKGIILAYHSNWTLDLDINNDSILVEAIPGITPTSDDFKKLIGPNKNDK